MPSYLVELYLSRSRAHEAPASGLRARAAAEDLGREGMVVRYVRTTFLPDDEMCFHVFEADSAGEVEEVCRRAHIEHARIVSVVEETNRSRRRPAC